MTILNDQKPPLDEALAHYGVKGMRWGVRRKQSSQRDDDDFDFDFDLFDRPKPKKPSIVLTGVGIAGATVAGALLYKTGHLPVGLLKKTPKPLLVAAGQVSAQKIGEFYRERGQGPSRGTNYWPSNSDQRKYDLAEDGADRVKKYSKEFWDTVIDADSFK